jgi:hypothetical protein
MSKMIAEIYDALKAAGTPDDKARDAAKAVAEVGQENRLDWMLGVIIAGVASLILKAFF